jgi:hypothetical protein
MRTRCWRSWRRGSRVRHGRDVSLPLACDIEIGITELRKQPRLLGSDLRPEPLDGRRLRSELTR